MNAFDYLKKYKDMIAEALDTVDDEQFNLASDHLTFSYTTGFPVFVFGNGGSAAIAEHLSCDHMKGVRSSTDMKPNIVNLSSNMSVMTAIANDMSYDRVYSTQIEYMASYFTGAAVAISSSGNSPNIVNGLITARAKGLKTIALVGFDGGKVLSDQLADAIIHVKSDNYGVVEDCHQIIMHALAQDMRVTFGNGSDSKL